MVGDKVERKIKIENNVILHELFGNFDENLKIIETRYRVNIFSSLGDVIIKGEEEKVEIVFKLLKFLVSEIESGKTLDYQKLEYSFSLVEDNEVDTYKKISDEIIVVTSSGKFIKAKTKGQYEYFEKINKHDVTIGIGPAGTGKTYLAVAMAVKAFKNKEVNRIVITRPAVEAGERLGFLPGDLQMKVDPYLRPLYDALYDILGAETYLKLKEKGLIEVAPLAYMRGRTLDNSFIILDEAQNTTKEQMKMFLTRFGFGSKVVVNGDITQIDLPNGKMSGLIHASKALGELKEIGFVYFTEKDVVRHSLVRKIIKSYEKYENRSKGKK
ncbi:MAG: PhoH family protein [Clostridiales bacterium]|nr:PhoH family protein [Clostridiales bacterium]